MVKSAAACLVRGGVSGERPLGRVKVPEGIDEAWRVARDLPAEPWPVAVRLEVRSVQLRAHYAVGVAASDVVGILMHEWPQDVFNFGAVDVRARGVYRDQQGGRGPREGENGCRQQPFRIESGEGGKERGEPGGANQKGPVLASGVFVLADVRYNGGFSARTVGVYVKEDGGVIDFLEEEEVEVVLEVSEKFAAHSRFLLQVVGQKTQF